MSDVDAVRRFMEADQQPTAQPTATVADAVTLPPEQQHVLEQWEQAERVLNGKTWTTEEREAAVRTLQEFPTLQPTVIDFAKFGSVNALLARHRAILGDLVTEGMITHDEAEESAKMAVTGRISMSQVIAEGKQLKQWLLHHRAAKGMTAEFQKMREREREHNRQPPDSDG